METSTPKSSPIRPKLVLPLSRIVVESADRSDRNETSSSSSSELLMMSSSEVASSLASTLMTPVRHHHLSRHHCLSPSNSQSPFQLDLLSPSSTHSTVLQAQQQQQTEMSFTSAFTSTLRNRRGKTLILPKLKIPRSSKSGDQGAADDNDSVREVQSSSIHHWRHSENLSSSTTHFRRSVSSSTFTESAAWYSSRQSSTSNMSEVISGSSWVKKYKT